MAYTVAFRKTAQGLQLGEYNGLGAKAVVRTGPMVVTYTPPPKTRVEGSNRQGQFKMQGLEDLGDDSTKLSTGEWVAIGAAALLAVGGGIYLGTRSRRRTSAAIGWMSYPGKSRRRRRGRR